MLAMLLDIAAFIRLFSLLLRHAALDIAIFR